MSDYEKEAYRYSERAKEKSIDRSYKDRLRSEDRQYREEQEQNKRKEKLEDRAYKEEQDTIKQLGREELQDKRHQRNLEAFNYKTEVSEFLSAESAKIIAEKELKLAHLQHQYAQVENNIQLKKEILFLELELQVFFSRLEMERFDYNEREEADLSRRYLEAMDQARLGIIKKLSEIVEKKFSHKQEMEKAVQAHRFEKDRMSHDTNERIKFEKFLYELKQDNNEKTDEEIVAILSKHMK